MKYCHLGSQKKKEKKKVDFYLETEITVSLDYEKKLKKKKKKNKHFYVKLAFTESNNSPAFQIKHSEIIVLPYLPCSRCLILKNHITHINIVICNRQSILFVLSNSVMAAVF